MLKNLEILTLSNLPIEKKLKDKLPLLPNIMNTNNQQEIKNKSQELVKLSLPKKMTRWLVHIEEVDCSLEHLQDFSFPGNNTERVFFKETLKASFVGWAKFST